MDKLHSDAEEPEDHHRSPEALAYAMFPFPRKNESSDFLSARSSCPESIARRCREITLNATLKSLSQFAISHHRKDLALFCECGAPPHSRINAILTHAGEAACYLLQGYRLRNPGLQPIPQPNVSWFQYDVSDIDMPVTLRGHFIEDADVDADPEICGYNFRAWGVRLQPI